MTNRQEFHLFVTTPFAFAWAVVIAFLIFALPYNLRAQEQGAEGTTQQPPMKVTDPEFIVIYNFRSEEADPLINLRVVIRAKSESDSIVRATLWLNKQFGRTIDMEKLQFVEVGPAPGTHKKDEKK